MICFHVRYITLTIIKYKIDDRKRKRSESDLLPSPGRPKNGEAAMDEAARPLNAEDLTFKDEMLSNLLEIFPDKKPAYLKVVILFTTHNFIHIIIHIILNERIILCKSFI